MGWLQSLQSRWKVKSVFQVLVILTVFACTGLTVVYISRPFLALIFDGNVPNWARVVYYIVILPFYNLFLLIYGFLFGQFHFFWNFEKRFLNRIFSIFKKKN